MATVTWSGTSGSKYETELCEIGRPFTTNPGVYIFCKPGREAGKWKCLYVGECENFNDRLNTNLEGHHRWDCIKKHGATHVCVTQVNGGKLSRTAVETDLRQRLDPPCNRQ